MAFIETIAVLLSCTLIPAAGVGCARDAVLMPSGGSGQVAGQATEVVAPVRVGEAVDVILTGEAALAWDEKTGLFLYEKNADTTRPVASLTKLLSALVVRDRLTMTQLVEIPNEVRRVQRIGASVNLPIGDSAKVHDLLAASLIASANDALVTLANEVGGTEAGFVEMANEFAIKNGVFKTKISNATGLDGGEQYSTARDIRQLFRLAFRDRILRTLMASAQGELRTERGVVRRFESTNKLFGTYVPVLAGKTGYTLQAGENLVVMAENAEGHQIGAVILGSRQRFQDMKVLLEWIERNYNWE